MTREMSVLIILAFNTVLFAVFFIALVSIVMRGVRAATTDAIRLALSRERKPLAVVFDPDAPDQQGHYWADAWVQTVPSPRVHIRDTEGGRWRDGGFSYGCGYARIEDFICTFRAVQTDMEDEMIERLRLTAENEEIDPVLLSELSERDPDEVFSIIEALGIVRKFDRALAKVEAAHGKTIGQNAIDMRRKLDL